MVSREATATEPTANGTERADTADDGTHPEAHPSRAPSGRPRGIAARTGRWSLTTLVLVALVWSVQGAGVSPGTLAEGREGGLQLLRGFLTPELSGDFLVDVAAAVAQTAQISITGLLIAVAAGLPTAGLLAGNVGAPAALRGLARVGGATLRGVPELLWALLFVAMIGPGPAAGALAIGLHGAGLLAKLGAEQFEAVKPAPIEAIRLTGASRTATAVLGIIPESRAGLASLLLYQWECNIRTSTVLGFVGAGGIGQELAISLKLFRYDELSTLVLAVLAVILAVDLLSRAIRRYLGAAT
jgi:phosphonate transport system permease protein